MSYRGFKRLLGENSLERKCRFLLGGFILLLVTGSFWLYASQTEYLAYEQVPSICRLLVLQVVEEKLNTVCRTQNTPSDKMHQTLVEGMRDQIEKTWPEGLRGYKQRVIVPGATREQNSPGDELSRERLQAFLANTDLNEENYLNLSRSTNVYFGAVRAAESCLACHRKTRQDLIPGDLLALVKVELKVPPESLESQVHFNRAILITTALATALLIMAGSYLIVRYVIVKPVKHLKEVSDAIATGQLNVRSEIQTGDEFEDLSHAFNRMLRSLVSMQDKLKRANIDLDSKVDELAQANLALYESNRLKDSFLATISHELRTPLNAILGFSDVLLATGGLNDKQERWTTNIKASGQSLLEMVQDILDLAKIESGKMELAPSDFSPTDILDGVLSMFRPLAEKKLLNLEGNWPAELPTAHQDPVKLQQILQNLLSNAIKFTPRGGTVGLLGRVDDGRLVLEVSDTGVGIAEDEQELVFEKFRQGGNPLTREHAGTGLGLSIVRELCQLMGGDISLRSELGKGSRFTVRLPLRLAKEHRMVMDLSGGIDLTKAQRVDARLFSSGGTRLTVSEEDKARE
jgi:two-component system sensor histidine kinase BarA